MMSADVKSKLTIVAVGLGAALSVAAAYKFYCASRRSRLNSKQLVKSWKAVGHVSSLHVYPIKSCHGIQVEEAECQNLGLVHKELQDRSFMVIGTNNNFLHARLHPTMVLIHVKVVDGHMTLTAPEMEPITFTIPSCLTGKAETRVVRIWSNEVPAVDCGDEVARWFSQYIFKEDSGARLVHYAYTDESPIRAKNAAQNPAAFPWMRVTDGAVFQDNNPYHLMSTESVDDLNSKLNGLQVSALYFRPTITISGVQRPYEEDEWRFVRIGEDAVMRFTKQCDRCVLTTIDPVTGIKHPEIEPLRTLKTYRQTEDRQLRSKIGESPLLGINLALDKPGHIRVGDVVYVGQL